MGIYNKTILIGRLGQDPVLEHLSTKGDVAKFTVVNTTMVGGIEDCELSHKISAFGKQATLCAEYLHKGDLCCIEGRLDTYTYEKDGVVKYAQTIIAEHITFLTSKPRTTKEI